jgi:hypothetical protein
MKQKGIRREGVVAVSPKKYKVFAWRRRNRRANKKVARCRSATKCELGMLCRLSCV